MNMPSKVEVDNATREMLAGLALGDPDLLAEGLELVQMANQERP